MRSGRDICEGRLAPTTQDRRETATWPDIVGRFAPYVAAVATAHRLPEPEAEELFQDVFAHTWTRADALSDDDVMRDWIVELTDRLATGRRRSSQTGAEPAPSLLDELHRTLVVGETIRLLPATQREVARRYADGEDVTVIAKSLGMDSNMVGEHLRRARRRVRTRLGTVRRSGRLQTFDV
jgi:DNA-directed RNA polymerase specialized sigma24 family protein